MRTRTTVTIAAAAALVSGLSLAPADAGGTSGGGDGPRWSKRPTGTAEQYRGLDAVGRRVAWVAGEDGGVLRTTDGGRTWEDVAPPRTNKLAFRDVEAQDARNASVLSIGPGTDSRIYTTDDGGESWTKAFVNRRPEAFYDCMAFWPGGRRGLAMSDPVDGKFRIIATKDGGHNWRVLSDRGMPRAVDGEFAFAASGTCLVTGGRRHAWLASGGAASRIFHTKDAGRNWTVADSTIPASPAGGVFSLSFRNLRDGVAVGGDFLKPRNGKNASSRSFNGGKRWISGGDLTGYRSGVAWVHGKPKTLVAVGPTGSDISRSGGRQWKRFSRLVLDAVSCTDKGDCWASGPEGMVARLRF